MKRYDIIVRTLRETGWSNAEAARRIGISANHIGRWLSGKTTKAHVSSVEKTAKAIDHNCVWLDEAKTRCIFKRSETSKDKENFHEIIEENKKLRRAVENLRAMNNDLLNVIKHIQKKTISN